MKAIWIIDDDKSIRWVFEKALARTDLNFKTFNSIKDALQAIKDEEPQVIVSDIRMPQGSGLELLQVIKEKYAHIPVIIMTAYSDLESAVAAFQGGAFEYLAKPFDVDQAIEIIHRAIDESLKQSIQEVSFENSTEMIGHAPSMQEVFRAIGRLSQGVVRSLLQVRCINIPLVPINLLLRLIQPRFQKIYWSLNSLAMSAVHLQVRKPCAKVVLNKRMVAHFS
jgi:two-component system nitrogen regulation response regulator GlnG